LLNKLSYLVRLITGPKFWIRLLVQVFAILHPTF